MTDNPKSRLCPAPWTQLNMTSRGNFRLCCRVNKDYHNAYDETGSIYNGGTHDVAEWWDSEYLRDIRTRMVNGEDMPECNRCHRTEDLGGTSHRMLSIDRWKTFFGDKDFATNKYPIDVEARLGNLCNLKCVMCGPGSSSQHFKERLDLQNKGVVDKRLPFREYKDWDMQRVVNGIVDMSEYIRVIRLYGGEPTIMPEVHDMLERLVDNGTAGQIHLKFNTNLTNINERFVELMGKFYRVSIHVSVDGYGSVQEYIRFPSKWSALEKNIKTVLELIRDNDSIGVVFMPTVQILNVLNVDKLIHWLDEQRLAYGITRGMNVSFSMVENPSHYQPELLPLEAREEAIRRLSSFRNFSYVDEKCVDLVINTLTQGVVKDTLYNDFWRVTGIYDNHRGNSLEDGNKELYDIMRAAYRGNF